MKLTPSSLLSAANRSSSAEHPIWAPWWQRAARSWKNWDAELGESPPAGIAPGWAGGQQGKERATSLESVLKVLAEATLFLSWELKVLSLCPDVLGDLEGRWQRWSSLWIINYVCVILTFQLVKEWHKPWGQEKCVWFRVAGGGRGTRHSGLAERGSQYPWGASGTRNGRDIPVHGGVNKMQKIPLVAASFLLCSPADGVMSDTSSSSRYKTGKA